jgi:DNA-binding CsgD family transcriptional regulator
VTTELYVSLMGVANEEQLLQELVTFSEKLGFDQACAFMTMRRTGTAKLVIRDVNNYSEAWKTSSYDEVLWRNDPLTRHAKTSNLPLVWNRALYEKAGAGDLWELARTYGFDSGIAISLSDHLGNGYKVGLSRDQPLTTDPAELSRLVADAQLFGAFAQSAMMRIWNPKPEVDLPNLTAREVECLSWTLEGKTAWELGVILGITERTANFHLGNAIQKLDCDNKHSAVIKAMRMGLIR